MATGKSKRRCHGWGHVIAASAVAYALAEAQCAGVNVHKPDHAILAVHCTTSNMALRASPGCL